MGCSGFLETSRIINEVEERMWEKKRLENQARILRIKKEVRAFFDKYGENKQ